MPRSASAWTPRGPTRSPQALSRGKRALSTSATRAPLRASTVAATLPAGPDPTTRTSKRSPPTCLLPVVAPTVRGMVHDQPGTTANRFARDLFAPLPRRYDLLVDLLSL